MRMHYLVPVVGGIGAVLLLGSFFVEDVPKDIMRLVGFVLLVAYCISKIMRSGKGGRSN